MARVGLLERMGRRLATSAVVARFGPRFVTRFDRALGRLTGGRFLSSSLATTSILLITTGARTGKVRSTPMVAVSWQGDHYVVGSNFGGEHHPGWSYNLLADPEAAMVLRGAEIPVRADLLDAEAKQTVWADLVEIWPPWASYAERTDRDLRVFRLVPR